MVGYRYNTELTFASQNQIQSFLELKITVPCRRATAGDLPLMAQSGHCSIAQVR